MPVVKSRFWCFTLHTDDISHRINKPEECKYLVYQFERGEQGKLHIQGYIEFTKPVGGGQKADWVTRYIKGAHTEVKFGSRDQARHYCIKPCSSDCEEKYCVEARQKLNGRIDWEHTRPIEEGTQDGEKGKRSDIEELKALIKTGADYDTVKDQHYGLCMKYERFIRGEVAKAQKKRDWKTKVICVYGKAGAGKSRWVHDTYPNAYWLGKTNTGTVWWNEYAAHEVVVIDDFYGWIPFDYMLRLCDRYPMTGETKGGVVNIVPKVLIITSNQSPAEWYRGVFKKCPEFEKAFSRRIDEIYEYVDMGVRVTREWKSCGGTSVSSDEGASNGVQGQYVIQNIDFCNQCSSMETVSYKNLCSICRGLFNIAYGVTVADSM